MAGRAILFCAVFLILFASSLFPQMNYFYTGKEYGSEALFNPVSLFLNAGYDILQINRIGRGIFEFDYRASSQNLFKSLGSPLRQINDYGWNLFLTSEIFPLNFDPKNAQWFPNYQIHLIGGGMVFTKLKEWYRHHGVPEPALMSFVTWSGIRIFNEAVENIGIGGANVDPIADLYFFDLASFILFSFDNVNEFFSEDLHLADWSLQPVIGIPSRALQNNGQYFSIKIKLPFSEKLSLFYHFGMASHLGLSYAIDDSDNLSAGIGGRARNLINVDNTRRHNTINTVFEAGVFWDRNHSLMASLLLSARDEYCVHLNVFPGVLKIGEFSPGFFWALNRNQHPTWGITTRLGFGFGYSN
ncbi:hypothetical protein BAC3_01865 [uncultured bacterium]|nr:hypothetical protein BAC3_01865 [uncultured bacterium]